MPISNIFSKDFILHKWNHSGFQKYLRNTSWMLFAQMFSLVVAFFISAWLARYFGPEKYGMFSYAVAFVSMFSFIVNLGVDSLLSKELVSNPKERESLMGTGIGIKFAGALVAMLCVLLSSFIFVKDESVRLLIIVYSLVFAFEPLNLINVFFQSQVKSKIISIVKIYVLVISSVLKISLILLGLSVVWLTTIFVVESFFANILLVYFYRREGLSIFNWKLKPALAYKMLSSSVFLVLASACNYILTKVDQLMIGSLLGNVEVGLYAVAVRFVDIWYFIPVILTGSLFPAIVNSRLVDRRAYIRRIKFFFYLMFTIGVLVSLVSWFIAPFVINYLFGAQYFSSIHIVQVYSLSSIGVCLGWGIQNYLLSDGKIKQIFIYYFTAMCLSLILNFLLIGEMGVIGGAYAAVISTISTSVVFILINLYKVRFSYIMKTN